MEKKKFEKRLKGICIPEFTEKERTGTDSQVNGPEFMPMRDSQNNLVGPSK